MVRFCITTTGMRRCENAHMQGYARTAAGTAASLRHGPAVEFRTPQQAPSSVQTPHWPVVPGTSLVVHHLASHLWLLYWTSLPPR